MPFLKYSGTPLSMGSVSMVSPIHSLNFGDYGKYKWVILPPVMGSYRNFTGVGWGGETKEIAMEHFMSLRIVLHSHNLLNSSCPTPISE